jgi:hypothetical protein
MEQAKIFLVKVQASVWDNDNNFIVIAQDEKEAKQIVCAEHETITKDAEKIYVQLLTPNRTKASNWKEFLPNGKGIIHEYDPHAENPNAGD